MAAGRSLPVIMPEVPNQRWSCHSCGKCCRALVAHLSEEDVKRLDRQGWAGKMDLPPYVPMAGGYVLNKTPDGRCVFLEDDNRCRIHARYGEAEKPLACRIFPFSVRPVEGQWQASLRFDCPSVVHSHGKPLAQYRPWLSDLVTSLDHNPSSEAEAADLAKGLRATGQEVDAVVGRLRAWMAREDLPLLDRLFTAARLTSALNLGRYEEVRGREFADLIDSLFETLPTESRRLPPAPSRKQRGMLRQLAFAHSEHVSPEEVHATFLARMKKRWQQLREARVFLKGQGIVPRLPGFGVDTTFEVVESVEPAAGLNPKVDELLRRYVSARFDGRSLFGEGYYGWPIFAGLGALWLALAATGWIARYVAATNKRKEMHFDDVGEALGIVDRAATRVPSLGTTAERMRLSYLVRDDGLAALVHEYVPLSRPAET
jgi:lysine-N-methylase